MVSISLTILIRINTNAIFKDISFFYSAVFYSNNLLVVVVELDGNENAALDLVPLVMICFLMYFYIYIFQLMMKAVNPREVVISLSLFIGNEHNFGRPLPYCRGGCRLRSWIYTGQFAR